MPATLSKVFQSHLSRIPTCKLTKLATVVARFRPPNKAEIASGGESIVDFETEDTCKISVCIRPPRLAHGRAWTHILWDWTSSEMERLTA